MMILMTAIVLLSDEADICNRDSVALAILSVIQVIVQMPLVFVKLCFFHLILSIYISKVS